MFGSIEAVKTGSDLFLPMSGKVIETNRLILKDPTWVNRKPFENGRLVKIENKLEIVSLLKAEQNANATTIRRCK